jgi:hypothetical protein
MAPKTTSVSMQYLDRRMFCRLSALASFGVLAGLETAAASLEYGRRNGRYEGLRSGLVSGFDISLIGAKVTTSPQTESDHGYLAFYRPADAPIYIAVREYVPVHQYWLDQVEPSALRRSGSLTVTSWPLSEVVQQISQPRISLQTLLPLVRVGSSEPSARVTVAPAFLSYQPPPYQCEKLRFDFFLREDADLNWTLNAGKTSLKNVSAGRVSGSTPFSIDVDPRACPASTLTLTVTGSLSRSAEVKLFQQVTFENRFKGDIRSPDS